MKTIFITIPSYEDSSLLDTINDAIAKAKNPQSLYFAVALQYKQIPLPDLSKYYNDPNFNFISYDVDTRPGVNQVRHNLLRLYGNQDYLLMIDSHTNFMQDWDIKIIDDYARLQQLGHDRVVFSRYMDAEVGQACHCNYKDLHGCIVHLITNRWLFAESDLQNDKIIIESLASDRVIDIDKSINHDEFIKTNYITCQFVFADSRYVREVGVVDRLSFFAEEVSQSVRAFYAGWDVYAPMVTAYLQHNSTKYDLEFHGSDTVIRNKTYAKREDYLNIINDVRSVASLYANNSGDYSVPNAVRTPEQFFDQIGLGDNFKKYNSQ